MPETPNINSPDVFDSQGQALVAGGGGGASSFLGLTDTPSSYSGKAGFPLVVGATVSGVTYPSRKLTQAFSLSGTLDTAITSGNSLIVPAHGETLVELAAAGFSLSFGNLRKMISNADGYLSGTAYYSGYMHASGDDPTASKEFVPQLFTGTVSDGGSGATFGGATDGTAFAAPGDDEQIGFSGSMGLTGAELQAFAFGISNTETPGSGYQGVVTINIFVSLYITIDVFV